MRSKKSGSYMRLCCSYSLLMMRSVKMCKVCFFFLICMVGAVRASCADRDKAIIAFGDSITVGYGEIYDQDFNPGDRVGGYEPDLEALTDKINNHYDVLNYGVSGERTVPSDRHPYPESGYYRLKERVLPLQPNAEFCLILEGTNDYWDGISRATTVWALGEMIKEVRKYGIVPIIGTLTPDTRPFAAGKQIPDINARIRVLATTENVPLADFYPAMIDEWNSLYSYVGEGNDYHLHPSRDGYLKMADIWYETLSLPSRLSPASWNILLLK